MAQPVLLERMVILVLKALRAQLVLREPKGNKVQLVHKALRAQLV